MKNLCKIVCSLGLVALIPFSTSAQETKSLLWKISGKGLEKPSYLFGTIHLMCPDDIKITSAMQEALSASEQLVLELDMDEPGIMQEMMGASMMKDGTTLQSLLNEEDYGMVAQYLKDSVGVPVQAVGTMKPMLLSSVIMLPVLGCQPGSYEMKLVEAAGEQQMEVLGLETVAEQIAVFDAIPLEEQSAYLVKTIREYDQSVIEIESLLEKYQQQDIQSLYQLIHESMAEMEGGEKALLDDRNQKWLPQIENMAKEKPTFFAVGAGHLAGPKGVISLLKKAGYQVQAVQ
ncbi:TraB/GumN family protein [Catalinimonas niigatensis]|uniref:TraB/GumN family protein n=1 Tax=Catalinimonas niigatensis TaxID=1397264 RepID=UPI0026662AFB|nr:TraB/GumN family protein [Catalinimonas niigatensis]WPP48561.1 TraB/GumN family protein [Catalinimonas niigatensis]